MLPLPSSRRTNCTLPSLVTLAFRPRNFSTASSATFDSFPNANPSTTMFASWAWKCSTPVELVGVAGRRQRRQNGGTAAGDSASYLPLRQLGHKCFACYRGKRLKLVYERARPQSRNLIAIQSGNRANEINPVSSIRCYEMARHRLRRFSQRLVE
jgi:hypothetical protein